MAKTGINTYSHILKNVRIFSKLAGNKKIPLTPFAGGISNANFKVEVGAKKYVARFGFETNKHLGINRKQEFYNGKIAAGLGIGPRVVGLFPEHDLLIAEYVEGRPLTAKGIVLQKNIEKIAGMLRKLHRGRRFKGSFDIYEVSEKYFIHVLKHRSPFVSEANRLRSDLKKIKNFLGYLPADAPSHLDLCYPNIISSKQGLKFIDWEYSANAYHGLDLAILSAMSDFSSGHDKHLLRAYGKANFDMKKFKLLKALALIREIGWDMIQVRYSKINFDYRKLTRDNLRKYRQLKHLNLSADEAGHG